MLKDGVDVTLESIAVSEKMFHIHIDHHAYDRTLQNVLVFVEQLVSLFLDRHSNPEKSNQES